MLTLCALASAVDDYAPFALAYEWDNVGLQIGDPAAPVERAVVALEVNSAVIAECEKTQSQALIVHHPLIFGTHKSVRADTPSGRLQMELIRKGIGLIAAHTNLDRVIRGTNGALAEALGLRDPVILEPATVDVLYKFTVFVPRDYTPKLIDAIHRGGGGRIGAYSHCTFRAPGTGTYVPEHGANPFAGQEGRFEQADEDRLETLVPQRALRSVLHEVRQAHPYEVVAYDVFPLHDADPQFGLGAVGSLPSRTTLRAFTSAVRKACGAEVAMMAGAGNKPVRRVAVITGSAGNTAAVVSAELADVLVTGELSYHHASDAVERGVGVITVGHAASERIFAPYFCREFGKMPRVSESAIELIPFTDFPEPWHPIYRESKDTTSNNAGSRDRK